MCTENLLFFTSFKLNLQIKYQLDALEDTFIIHEYLKFRGFISTLNQNQSR